MKTSGKCPKCEGSEILTVPGTVGAYGAGNNVPVGWRAVQAVPVSRFVCADCGFAEDWITDAAGLERIRAVYRTRAATRGEPEPPATYR